MPDIVKISIIFFQNRERVEDYAKQFSCDVDIGGSGWNFHNRLLYAEHMMPDYDLYGVDFSMGFTSRGCVRNCPWCVVPEKEGMIRDHAPVSEFLHPKHKKVILLDNNFQASPKWRENLEHLIEKKVKVNFNQGLDIRLMNEKFTETLSKVHYSNWKFTIRQLHFGFDRMNMKKDVLRGVRILEDHGIPMRHVTFYILVGFDTTIEQALERVQTVVELGATPYIMRYNQNSGEQNVLNHLARWVNGRYYQIVPDFRNYDRGNSQKAINEIMKVPPNL